MRQIKDKNGNVLPEPYLTMANENFDPAFNSDFEQTWSLCDAFDFETWNNRAFWCEVWQGKAPTMPTAPSPTVHAATTARKLLETSIASQVAGYEVDYGAKVCFIDVNRDAEGGPEIKVRAMI